MKAPVIGDGKTDPVRDGDISRFIAGEAEFINQDQESASWFDHARNVIFVNGMMNNPSAHSASARALSVLMACPVIGVYNKTAFPDLTAAWYNPVAAAKRLSGLFADLVQCATDKLNLVIEQSSPVHFDEAARIIDQMQVEARARGLATDRRAIVAEMIKDNPAAYALYALLVGDGGLGIGTPIYCHSQGNLITSNALTAVALAMGRGTISGLEVNSYGSPCRYWPEGLNRTNNAYTFDPVSLLDLRADLTSSKVGFKGAHGFDEYLKQDGEFVVNRFRWGSFGLTASMDEVGLAEFCVSLGNNPRRLGGIFARVQKRHASDSDDIAYEYCKRVSDTVLRQIAASDRGVIEQLVSMLNDGFISPGEGEQIERLAGILGRKIEINGFYPFR